MRKLESHTIEYKQSWQEQSMNTICAFANTEGGTMFIGKDDDGNIKGLSNVKSLLVDIPNKIFTTFGFHPEVKLKKGKGGEYIAIKIKLQASPVSLRGKFYIRSGSTTHELKGAQLQRFLLEKGGLAWDAIIEEDASLKNIDLKAISHFKELSLSRFPEASKEKSIPHLLEKLHLSKNGKLTRAAILLFGKNPQNFHINSIIRIGRFKDASTLLYMDQINGNLFYQIEETLEILKKKYLHADVKIDGLARKEELEYPEKALREAIVNAVAHRDYMENDTQIKVYPMELSLWNNGGLTGGLTIEKLKKKHSSHPRNGLIADVFHKAGYIEKWGTGTVKMVSECKAVKLPEPLFEETEGGMQVTFFKDIYTEESLRKIGLNARQIKAVLYVKENGSIVNSVYQSINNVIRKTAARDLANLLLRGIFHDIGNSQRTAEYTLKH